jgi:hypothetical protein
VRSPVWRLQSNTPRPRRAQRCPQLLNRLAERCFVHGRKAVGPGRPQFRLGEPQTRISLRSARGALTLLPLSGPTLP